VFHRPISDAAQELGLGVTMLKKQCRTHGIQRWPYRKLSSLAKLIASVKEVRQLRTPRFVYALVAGQQRPLTCCQPDTARLLWLLCGRLVILRSCCWARRRGAAHAPHDPLERWR